MNDKNAVEYDRLSVDARRPGIANIREELRQQGCPVGSLDSQAKIIWEHRHNGGPAPRGFRE